MSARTNPVHRLWRMRLKAVVAGAALLFLLIAFPG